MEKEGEWDVRVVGWAGGDDGQNDGENEDGGYGTTRRPMQDIAKQAEFCKYYSMLHVAV